jgi:hypothetical protein
LLVETETPIDFKFISKNWMTDVSSVIECLDVLVIETFCFDTFKLLLSSTRVVITIRVRR